MADNSLQGGADTIRDKDRAGVKTQIFGRDLNIGGATEVLELASALADATANPTAPLYGSASMVYNGTTWDRMRGTIANGVLVDPSRAAPDVTASGTLTAAAQTVTLSLTGHSGASAQVTGTWVGTLTFEASLDGTTWTAINAVSASTSSPQTTTTVNGLYRLTPAGTQQMRVNMTAFTSGSAVILVRASVGTGGIFANQILPTKITDGTNTATIKAASTAAVAADPAIVVALSPNNTATLTAETTKVIGTVNIAAAQTLAVQQAALTKGTQGATGITVQALNDAGRNPIHFYTVIPVLTSATDTLQSLTGTKSGATVTATTTPAVVTTGKTFRVTRLAATYVATATSGYGVVRLRFNTAGVAAITSPVAATITVGAGTPATANSLGFEEASLAEGWEFAAATGVGISVQGFSAVTATAVGYITVSITGYEY